MSRMLQGAVTALRPSRPEPGLTVLDPVVTRLRVLPQDLDYMMVVNNGTYLQLMDVASHRHLGRNGALRLAAKRSWFGYVVASTMRYRRPLRLWDWFEDTSRVPGWDDRVFYMEHVITRDGELCTRGVICYRLVHRSSREPVSPHDIVPLLAEQQGYVDAIPESPELPADVVAWARSWPAAHR
ncbi:acyl-CoA thioesterase [Promicromonospora sp. NFX87]|uniref:acyl-CoA thioesterase n=1 Tax=Promicromonospora sp. NFX87 TaxID=3402691 RepID=UPI003AFB404D